MEEGKKLECNVLEAHTLMLLLFIQGTTQQQQGCPQKIETLWTWELFDPSLHSVGPELVVSDELTMASLGVAKFIVCFVSYFESAK